MHDLVLDAEIGVYTHEKGVTQRARFSVDIEVTPASQAIEDQIGRVLDYDMIIATIKTILAEGHINLVETLADEIATRCLAHPRAASVKVKIEKLDKEPGAVGVEIVRRRERSLMHARPSSAGRFRRRGLAPQPGLVVVKLGGSVVRSPELSAWLDVIAASPRPIVVVPGGGALADEVRAAQAAARLRRRRCASHGAARHGPARLGRCGLALRLRGRRHRGGLAPNAARAA